MENPHDFVNVTFSKAFQSLSWLLTLEVMSFLPGYDETLDLQEPKGCKKGLWA